MIGSPELGSFQSSPSTGFFFFLFFSLSSASFFYWIALLVPKDEFITASKRFSRK
jgi:hypothetical protein